MQDKFFYHLEKAYSYISNNEYYAAYMSLQKSIHYVFQAPNKVRNAFIGDVLVLAGRMALNNNFINEAHYYFVQALIYDPDSSSASDGLEEVLEKCKNAKKIIEWSVKNLPENQNALADLGKLNQILGIRNYSNSLYA